MTDAGRKYYFSEPFASRLKRAMVAADETRKNREAGKPAPIKSFQTQQPLTGPQRAYLIKLGYTGPTGITKTEASALIGKLLGRK